MRDLQTPVCRLQLHGKAPRLFSDTWRATAFSWPAISDRTSTPLSNISTWVALGNPRKQKRALARKFISHVKETLNSCLRTFGCSITNDEPFHILKNHGAVLICLTDSWGFEKRWRTENVAQSCCCVYGDPHSSVVLLSPPQTSPL